MSEGVLIKSARKDIRTFCIGDWDMLPMVYRNILNYADENGLSLNRYAYEERFDEVMINDIREYITQIMIACE